MSIDFYKKFKKISEKFKKFRAKSPKTLKILMQSHFKIRNKDIETVTQMNKKHIIYHTEERKEKT